MSRRFPDAFRYDEAERLWMPSDPSALTEYSDGDPVEEAIGAIVAKATDLSHGSAELRAEIRDWPTRYYLSPERAAALEMLELPRNARVLELGAGCGAIEGSRRRAGIAASRCRDLPNVRVACGRFDDLDFEERYDFVLLIGVLEYAALYGEAEDPYREVLERARAALAPRQAMAHSGRFAARIARHDFGIDHHMILVKEPEGN